MMPPAALDAADARNKIMLQDDDCVAEFSKPIANR